MIKEIGIEALFGYINDQVNDLKSEDTDITAEIDDIKKQNLNEQANLPGNFSELSLAQLANLA